jgi:hypothetical protein
MTSRRRAMLHLRSRPLFHISIEPDEYQILGTTHAGGERMTVPIKGGAFEGDRLSGAIMPGGSDWIIKRPDDVLQLNVRITLKTNDGELIAMRYRGLRHGSPEDHAKATRGEQIDWERYYFRTAIEFETAAEKYRWLNNIFAIGVGYREAGGPRYFVHEIL